MQTRKSMRLSGTLFLLAGVAFIASTLFSGQVAHIGVAVAFIVIGTVFINRSRQLPKA